MKYYRIKKFLTLLLCLSVLLSGSFSVMGFAADLSDEEQEKVDDIRTQQAQLEQKIAEAQNKKSKVDQSKAEKQAYADQLSTQIGGYQAQIEKLTANIAVLETEKNGIQSAITDLDKEIANIQVNITANEKETAKTQNRIDVLYTDFKTRQCEIYVNGATSDLELLLDCDESNDFETYLIMREISQCRAKKDEARVSELNEEIEKIDVLTEKYNSMIADVQVKKDEQQVQIANLDIQQKNIESTRTELQNSQNELIVLQTEAFTYINELDKESDTYASLVEQYEAENTRFENMIDEVIREHAASTAAAEAAHQSAAEEEESYSGGTPTTSSGSFIWPLQYSDARISSSYGYRYDPISGVYKLHAGTDTYCLSGTMGKNVVASASGTVITAGFNSGGYGYYVIISHGNNMYTLYGHNSSLVVSEGEYVSQGQTIAYAGSTGYATGAHCHFEVRIGDSKVDATNYASLP